MVNTGWNFDNTYRKLSQDFYSIVHPVPVNKPELILLNTRIADELGLDFSKKDRSELASIFTGNQLPDGAEPIAQAYAGHQFGHFTMLGDGRAIVLGEHVSPDGKRFDIQFKGSGRTPYSRSGDGRATLYSMLREYLISEALYHLRIPASGSLAVVETGLPVYRESVHPGAVLTRVASSHIRIGTFEYAARFLSREKQHEFLDYTIARHYADLGEADNIALGLLKRVADKHLNLVIEWMRIGFIHGVLNTDNMSISGESIDFGPCSFMNAFNPSTAFSSVDINKRYAFSNQPGIVQWNLAIFAGTLLRFIDDDEEKAREVAQEVIIEFESRFEGEWYRMMGNKLGFNKTGKQEKELINKLLSWMQRSEADYTNTFLIIYDPVKIPGHFKADENFHNWHLEWKTLIEKMHGGLSEAHRRMARVNPLYIPRNHLVEEALTEASTDGNYTKFHRLLNLLKNPYQEEWKAIELQQVPPGFDEQYKTYCGT
ncbi:MAG: YdiU family protein [Balneolaceae bacterium]|nr:MAG: YdiU family protein [Balneolaceae bacterium]